ncbi:MAG: UDP-galactopyranose mutase [Christensenellales bacterium]|jgi:UDP-galactopyranose mutase
MKAYDYLIVGAGLFGAVFAREAMDAGKRCLVIERRAQAGGNLYCEARDGINLHTYGAHIFHTSSDEAWDYMRRFARFNHYVNAPIANYKGEIYNLPFNMNTFSRLWGISKPEEAMRIIEGQRGAIAGEPRNLEEQAISLVGRDVYEKLIKGYTEKQWGRDCKELPAFIIRRLPVRFTYDNNYFTDPYQGIPMGGYNAIIDAMLKGADIELNTDFLKDREKHAARAARVVYTGPIDQYYQMRYGALAYRSLRFETEKLDMPNYQGVAVVNYTDRETPYTRIIEHKHFEFGAQDVTYVTREYPAEWQPGDEPYYPVNDEKNSALYQKYRALADAEPDVVFGGRLADYAYYDMDKTVLAALKLAKQEL